MVTPSSKEAIEVELQQSFPTYEDALTAWYEANPYTPPPAPTTPEEYAEQADADPTGYIQTFPTSAAKVPPEEDEEAPPDYAPPAPEIFFNPDTEEAYGDVTVYATGQTKDEYGRLREIEEQMRSNLSSDKYQAWVSRHFPRYELTGGFAPVGPRSRPFKKESVGDVETGLIYKPVEFVSDIPGGYSISTEYRYGAHKPPPDFYKKERDLINYNIPKTYGVAQVDLTQKKFVGETGTFVPIDKRAWERGMESNIVNIYDTGQESRLRALGLAPSRRMLYAPRQMLTPEEKALGFFTAGAATIYALTPWELPSTTIGIGKELVKDVSERGIIGGVVEFAFDKPRRAFMLQPEITGGGLVGFGALGLGAAGARVTSKRIGTKQAKEYKVFEADRFVEIEAGAFKERVAFGEYKIRETAPALKEMIAVDRLRSESILSDGLYTQIGESGVKLTPTPKGFKKVAKVKAEFDVVPFPKEHMRVAEFFERKQVTEASLSRTIKARARLMQEEFLLGKKDSRFSRIEAFKELQSPIHPDLPTYKFRKLKILREPRTLTTPEGISIRIDTPIKLPEYWKPTIFEPTGKGPKTPLSDTFKPPKKVREPKPPRPVRVSKRSQAIMKEEGIRPTRADLQREPIAISYEAIYEPLTTPPGFKFPGGASSEMVSMRSGVRMIQGVRPISIQGVKTKRMPTRRIDRFVGRKTTRKQDKIKIVSPDVMLRTDVSQLDRQIKRDINKSVKEEIKISDQISRIRTPAEPTIKTPRIPYWPMGITRDKIQPQTLRTKPRRQPKRVTEYTPSVAAWAANIRKKVTRAERKARFTGFELRPIPLDKPIKRKSKKKTKRRGKR